MNHADPNVNFGPMQYADALPSEKRLETFQRLARLTFDPKEVFKAWADGVGLTGDMRKQAESGFLGCWGFLRVYDMFDTLRVAAVMDESFRLPQIKLDNEDFRGNVENKFAALMQRISLLALTIQREYETKTEVMTNGSSNSDSECNHQ